MNITSADIAKLRKITGAGMMDCKEALNAANGDFNEAIDYLRKKGQKISAKRADKEASEGIILAKTSKDHTYGIVIELNCETDFVAKNEAFIAFGNQIAEKVLEAKPGTIDDLLSLTINGLKVSELLEEQMGKIGEKIQISSYKSIAGTLVVPYTHLGNKIGVLVSLSESGDDNMFLIAKDVAMQIAAMNPIAVDEDSIPKEVIAHEMEIAKEQVKTEGKPDHIAEKIAQGKVNKFIKESTLLSQDFVKDSSKTVFEVLNNVKKGLTVSEFTRISIGN